MNLLCPNCQQNITVPDQYAGQVMRCPLCNGNFRAPGLPPAVAPSRPNASTPSQGPVVSVSPPPVPPPLTPPAGESNAPATMVPSPDALAGLGLAGQPSSPPELPSAPSEPPDYHHGLRLHFHPRVVHWLPLATLLVAFVLTFFPWVGLFPGDRALYGQNAWQAAFGTGSSSDAQLLQQLTGFAEKDLNEGSRASWVLILYLILFLVALAATVASTAVHVLRVRAPVHLEPLLRWRAALLELAVLAGLALLLLLAVTGFSLEQVVTEKIDKRVRPPEGAQAKEAELAETQAKAALAGLGLGRTTAFTLTIWLHVLAAVFLLLDLWLTRRGPGRPSPELALRW